MRGKARVTASEAMMPSATYKKTMTTQSTTITKHQEVEAILQKHGISFAIALLAKNEGNGWIHDLWRFTFGGRIVFSDLFKTGIGLRKMNSAGIMRPQFPKASDVLYCILSDAEALDQSFSDWCSCFGYDEDSRKDEGIYFQCCEMGKNVRKCFSHEQIEELKAALVDF